MTAIGIDTHKATLAACAIDELGRPIGEATFANDPAGHDAFIAWARSTAPEATVGIEGSSLFGAPLARSVQGAGLFVREVPPHLSRAERRRTRRPGKSDPGDALAIARVTARETNLPPIRLPDRTSEVQLLLEAREDLIGEATRARNRLHAHLPSWPRATAGRSRTSSRPASDDGRTPPAGEPTIQGELARSLLDRLRASSGRAQAFTRRIGALVDGHPLLALPGAEPITVARLVAEAATCTA